MKCLRWFVLLLLASPALAQYTTVSGTLTDLNGTVWNGAAVTAQFSPAPNFNGSYNWNGGQYKSFPPVTTIANGSGVFTMMVPTSTLITPSNTGWTWSVAPLASTVAVQAPRITVTGPTQDITTFLGPYLTPPAFDPTEIKMGYTDAEAQAMPGEGQVYFNTATNLTRQYYGGTWNAFGGGGSGLTGTYNPAGQLLTLANGLVTAIGNPFAVSISCTAAGTYEAGNATTNPNVCTFGYANGTPASGTLSDGTHNVTLTTPFTSGNLAFQYCTAGQGVAGFTFSVAATATNTQTAGASTGTACVPREFGGVGTSGATGATASGTTAVLAGATGTLASNGFGQQNTWPSTGAYNPSSQYIYILGTGSACTFTLGGFSFLMNSPISFSFINQYGAAIGMYLYRSVNPQSGPVTLVGTC